MIRSVSKALLRPAPLLRSAPSSVTSTAPGSLPFSFLPSSSQAAVGISQALLPTPSHSTAVEGFSSPFFPRLLNKSCVSTPLRSLSVLSASSNTVFCRNFSIAPQPEKPNVSVTDTVKTVAADPKHYVNFGIGTLGVMLVGQGLWWSMMELMNLTLWQSFVWGMGTGAVSTVVVGSSFMTLRSQTGISGQAVFRDAIQIVQKDDRVLAALGGPVTPGRLRAHHTQWAGFSKQAKFPYWRPRTVELLFQVNGKTRQGMISAEAVQGAGKSVVYKTLVLDVLTTGERIVLKGSEEAGSSGNMTL